MGRALVAAVWLLATATGLAVAVRTKIGPVVLTLSENHGIHLGDLLAFASAYGAAGALTARLQAAMRRAVHPRFCGGKTRA